MLKDRFAQMTDYNKINNRYKDLIKELIGLAMVCGSIMIVQYVLNIGCPIKYITGIPCFGCGMTRAAMSLLCLDFIQAFQYHPLVFLMPIFVFSYVYLKLKNKNSNNLIYCMCACFIIAYIIRVALSDPVLDMNLENGLIYKGYRLFLEGGKSLWLKTIEVC